MATGTLAPNPVFTGWDSNGNPLSGGKLYTYTAGTTTPVATYTNVGLTVANANPIILDSAGRAVIFLSPGASYKFLLKTSADVTVWTQDNVTSIPIAATTVDISGIAGEALTAGDTAYLSDGSGGKTAGQWFKADADFAYASTLPEIGFVVADTASQASGAFRQGGIVTGLSGLVIGAVYYVSATAGAITTTPPANSRLVGSADTTSSLVIAGNRLTPSTIQTTTATGTQNNFALTSGVRFLRCNNATLLTFTGFAGAFDGQFVWIESIGAGQVNLNHNDGSSSSPILNFVTSGVTPLAAGVGIALMRYDATTAKWRLLAHQQGAWVAWTPAWNGSGGTSGQVYSSQTGRIFLTGRQVSFSGRMVLTTLGTLTTSAIIAGLPYAGAGGIYGCNVATFGNLTTAVVSFYAFINGAVSTITMQRLTAAGTTPGNLVQADLSNTTDLTFFGTYETS